MQVNQKQVGRSKKLSGRAAFSLVEVLVGAAIAVIILESLFFGISTGFSLLHTTRQNLRATQILVSKLEGVRLCAWGNGVNQPSQLFSSTIIPNAFTDYFYPVGVGYQSNGEPYIGTITVTTNVTTASYSNQMALVTVSVQWSDGTRAQTNTHVRTMSTYVAQYGMQNYIWSH